MQKLEKKKKERNKSSKEGKKKVSAVVWWWLVVVVLRPRWSESGPSATDCLLRSCTVGRTVP